MITRSMNLVFIDHLDSFSENLIDWLLHCSSGGVDLNVVNHEELKCSQRLGEIMHEADALLLSPGPLSPSRVPWSKELVAKTLGFVPIFGVCLGHQILGEVAGFSLVQSRLPLHGGGRAVLACGASTLLGEALAEPRWFASYNSLELKEGDVPNSWAVTARAAQGGSVQAIERHVLGEAPAWGVQFHPESFLSMPQSEAIGKAFWREARLWYGQRSDSAATGCIGLNKANITQLSQKKR